MCLCDSVTEESIIKLVEALCNEPEEKIPLIKVSDAKLLGEWAGLCQLDRDGNARKVVGASCVVVKNWGADSDEKKHLVGTLFSTINGYELIKKREKPFLKGF